MCLLVRFIVVRFIISVHFSFYLLYYSYSFYSYAKGDLDISYITSRIAGVCLRNP